MRIICWRCEKVIAEADTEKEARELAEEQDAVYHRESGDWCHEECYNAQVSEMIGRKV